MLKYFLALIFVLSSIAGALEAATKVAQPVPPKTQERRIDGGTYCDGDRLIQVTWYCLNDLGTNCRKDEQSVGSCTLCNDTMSCAM